jgi:hypothetical protein
MKPVVYDAGVLIHADRNVRRVWAEHRVRLEAGIVPAVPAAVVAQTSRSPRQASLRRLLRGCEVVALDEQIAHAVGALLGKAGTNDIADASVVMLATERRTDIASDDAVDMRRLLAAAGRSARVLIP